MIAEALVAHLMNQMMCEREPDFSVTIGLLQKANLIEGETNGLSMFGADFCYNALGTVFLVDGMEIGIVCGNPETRIDFYIMEGRDVVNKWLPKKSASELKGFPGGTRVSCKANSMNGHFKSED